MSPIPLNARAFVGLFYLTMVAVFVCGLEGVNLTITTSVILLAAVAQVWWGWRAGSESAAASLGVGVIFNLVVQLVVYAFGVALASLWS